MRGARFPSADFSEAKLEKADLEGAQLPGAQFAGAAAKEIQSELRSAFSVLGDLLEFHRNTVARDGILDMNSIAERVLRFRGYAIRDLGIALGD